MTTTVSSSGGRIIQLIKSTQFAAKMNNVILFILLHLHVSKFNIVTVVVELLYTIREFILVYKNAL